MTEDQFRKLAEIQNKLMDVFVAEADPSSWPGDGVALADMTRDERGDRKWCKQNAGATLVLLMHSQRMLDERAQQGRRMPPDSQPDEVAEDVAAFERQAQKVIAKALSRTA
jgi:hypothetical protein